jgi:hypothetical protein
MTALTLNSWFWLLGVFVFRHGWRPDCGSARADGSNPKMWEATPGFGPGSVPRTKDRLDIAIRPSTEDFAVRRHKVLKPNLIVLEVHRFEG